MKRRAYKATEVKNVLLEEVLRSAPAGAATAGLDIGKYEISAVVRWQDGSFERPWKVRNPSEIERMVGLLRKVADDRPLRVAMESTGTYGDAMRAQLDQAGLEVRRVGGKAAHDYAEVFDGVPSQHDGKDAAVIAKLAAFGKSTPWPYRVKSESEAELAYWADWLDAQQSIQQLWTGRLGTSCLGSGEDRAVHCRRGANGGSTSRGARRQAHATVRQHGVGCISRRCGRCNRRS
jgi:transposase